MKSNETPSIGNSDNGNLQVQVLLSAPIFLSKLRVLVFTTQLRHKKRLNLVTPKVKFPMFIKHRGKYLATIYGKTKARPDYRVACSVSGRRRMKTHRTYGEAKRHADGLVRELAKGSQVSTRKNVPPLRAHLRKLSRARCGRACGGTWEGELSK
jgi:hypothetical protein